MFQHWRIRRRLVATVVGMTFVIVMIVAYIALDGSRGLMRNQIIFALLDNNQELATTLDGELNAVAAVTSTLAGGANLPLPALGAVSEAALAAGNGLIAQVNVYAPYGSDGTQITVFRQAEPQPALARIINRPSLEVGWIDAALAADGLMWYGPQRPIYQRDSAPVISAALATTDDTRLVWVDLPVAALEARLTALMQGNSIAHNSYSLLIDPAGDPIATYRLPPTVDEHADLSAALAQLEPGDDFAQLTAFDRWQSPVMLRSSLGTTGWSLVSILPENLLNNPVDQNILQVLLVVITGMLAVAFVAREAARQWMSEPLRRLTVAASEIGSGDLRYQIGYQGRGDEIGDLARALEDMKQNLTHSYEQLRRWGSRLERRVAARTMELEMARQEAQATAAELQAVYDASLSVVSDYQLTVILQTLAERISSLLDAEYCDVWLMTSDGRHLQLVASTPVDPERLNVLMPVKQGVAGLVVRDRQPVILDDYASWPGRSRDHDPALTQALGVPLTFYNEPIGAIIAGRAGPTPVFGIDDQRLVVLLANLVSPVIRSAQLYIRLGEAVTEARRADAMKTRFLASITHELRNPLNLIINNLDFMRIGEFGPVTAEQATRLDQTKRSAEHLVYLINDLLDVSKIETGQMQLTIADADLYPVLEDALDWAVSLVDQGAAVTLEADIPEDLPPIPMDARRVRQVLTNLLSNAIKFTPEGDVYLGVRLQADRVIFTVRDTGIGIPASEIETLFAMFERSDRARQLGIEGTGLGLPISRYLVEAHGGTMHVESAVGVGSTFSFTLPRTPPPVDARGKRVTAILPRPDLSGGGL